MPLYLPGTPPVPRLFQGRIDLPPGVATDLDLSPATGASSASLAVAVFSGITSRSWDGVDDELNTSIGSCNLNGALTMAALVRREQLTLPDTAIYNSTSAGGLTNARLTMDVSSHVALATSAGTTTFTAADLWGIIVATKAAGTVAPTLHIYKGGSWVHETGSLTVANAASQAGGAVRFAAFVPFGQFSKLDLAVAAEWNVALTNAQVEELSANWETQDWLDNTGGAPVGLWQFNQVSTGTDVTDVTGNGADQTTITGTSVNGDGPLGWVYYAPAAPADLGTLTASATCSATIALSAPDTSAAYPQLILGDDPDLYWRLGEPASFTTAIDVSGNNRHGDGYFGPGGGAFGVSGALHGDSDTALELYAPDVRIIFAIADYWAPWAGTSAFTVEGWFNYSGDTIGGNVSYTFWGDISGSLKLYKDTASDTITFQCGATSVTWTSTGFAADTWYHVVLRFNPSGSTVGELAADTAELFLNGRSLGIRTNAAAVTLPQSFYLGEWGGQGDVSWDGYIDEVAVWGAGSILTTAQIREHFLVGAGQMDLDPASGVCSATLVVSVPSGVLVPLVAASGVSSATLALTAPALLTLVPASGVSSATLALTAPAKVVLIAASAVSSATLSLTAPAKLTLAAASGICSTTLNLAQYVPLGAAGGISSATLTFTAPTGVVLGAASGVSTATLALSAQTTVTLVPASAASSATLVLTAPTKVVLDPASAIASATAVVYVPSSTVPLETANAVSSPTLTLTAAAKLSLSASGISSATLALSAATKVVLGAASGVCSATLVVTAPKAPVPLQAASAISSATLVLTARALLTLTASGVSSATLVLSAQTRVVLETASGLSSATLDLIIPLSIPETGVDLGAVELNAVATGAEAVEVTLGAEEQNAALTGADPGTVRGAAVVEHSRSGVVTEHSLGAVEVFPLGAVELNTSRGVTPMNEENTGGTASNLLGVVELNEEISAGTAEESVLVGVSDDSERSGDDDQTTTGGDDNP